MAAFVGVLGLPHTPAFPKLVATGAGPASEIAGMYERVRDRLVEMAPDVVVVLADDHFNTFFLDNFPALALGVADQTWGPNDGTDGLPVRPIVSHRALAAHLLAALTSRGYDLARSEKFSVDHAMVVPLHFVTPALDVPMVPLWVNALLPPIPTSERAWLLGTALVEAVEAFPEDLRVVAIASGSFSLEVGGVHIAPDSNFGVPDPAWTAEVVELLQRPAPQELIRRATPERLHRAGNVGGELLPWLAAWAVAGGQAPDAIEVQPQFGHAYAVWELKR